MDSVINFLSLHLRMSGVALFNFCFLIQDHISNLEQNGIQMLGKTGEHFH
nr:MAG TPA: hypothetical protein [Caudoviricetes sp.]